MYTRPIKLQQLLDEKQTRRGKSITRDVPIEDRPTQIIEVIQRPVITQPLPAFDEPIIEAAQQRPLRDAQGRFYVYVNNPYEETYALADALVARYYEYTGVYPTIILLSALRYLTDGRRMQHYYSKYSRKHDTFRIPFEYDGSVYYDVLCRGE